MKRKHKMKKTKFRMFYAAVIIAIFLTSSVSAITIKKETNDNQEPNISACGGSIKLAKATMNPLQAPQNTLTRIAKKTTGISGGGTVTIKVDYDMVASGDADRCIVEIYEGWGLLKERKAYVETPQEHKTGTLTYKFEAMTYFDEEYYFTVRSYCEDYWGLNPFLTWGEELEFKIKTYATRSLFENLYVTPYGIFWFLTAKSCSITDTRNDEALFKVHNNGDPESKLDWKITAHPTWGVFEFYPSSGTDLTPEQGGKAIDICFIAPEVSVKTVHTGVIRVQNMNEDMIENFIDVPVEVTVKVGESEPVIRFFPSGRSDMLQRLIQQLPIFSRLLNFVN